jgi:selenocysteine-specific elongation factor
MEYLLVSNVIVRAGDVVFAADTYAEMVTRITARLREKGTITLAEVRDMFGTSRRYAQALLEHLDAGRVTKRVGDERVLR